ALLGSVHQGSAQRRLVIYLHGEEGHDTRRVRDGLRDGRPDAFRRRPPLEAVRGGNPRQPAALEEVRRVGQRSEAGQENGREVTLAYVFFHRPTAGLAAATYEEALRRFHSALATAAPPGFIS